MVPDDPSSLARPEAEVRYIVRGKGKFLKYVGSLFGLRVCENFQLIKFNNVILVKIVP